MDRLAARMSAYYVIAIVIAVGAIVLSAIGLTREDFPPTVRAGRIVMAGTLLLVSAGIVALLATTHREHPREEAAEAREKAAEEQVAGEGKAGQTGPAEAGETVAVTEDEFSIALEGGDQLGAGPHTFAVANEGKIGHDLAIEGEGLAEEPKTPIIDPGGEADLEADLKPGSYRFYCTVPGHAESGMETDVEVR
jgi:plastocyanin